MSDQQSAMPRPGSDPAINHAAATMALADALSAALTALAEAKGRPGPWFDDLEAAALKSAKSMSMKHVDMRAEADAMQFAADVVGMVFARQRKRLGS